jgi:hypothetical protein
MTDQPLKAVDKTLTSAASSSVVPVISRFPEEQLF